MYRDDEILLTVMQISNICLSSRSKTTRQSHLSSLSEVSPVMHKVMHWLTETRIS